MQCEISMQRLSDVITEMSPTTSRKMSTVLRSAVISTVFYKIVVANE